MQYSSFQLDEFYLDLQADGNKISLLGQEQIESCPYPGLRPFRTSEFQLFKGREGQAEELIKRLKKNHFLAVIGSSGTGKSSLIRAGLIPQLYGGYLHEAGNKWNIAICRPGKDPIGNLSTALSSIKCRSKEKEKIAAEHSEIEPILRRSVYGILEANELLPGSSKGDKNNLLIIIDQFEELFRFDRKTTEYKNIESHFVNLILKASMKLDSSVYVIITMRSEFLGECVKYRGLPEVINEGQYLVPQLSRTQIKEVIEGPLKLANKKIDPGLLEVLINEIEETRLKENLDQLPILQHALMRTYIQAIIIGHKEMICHPDYEYIGGMQKALAEHADAKYRQLETLFSSNGGLSKKQQITKIVFQALTDQSQDQKGGRRPVEMEIIYAITDPIGASRPETDEVIDHFREADTSFIMPPANTTLDSSLILDISHESLMRNWDLLNSWMLEEVRYGELYSMLNERRALFEQEDDKDNWLRGILLKELIKWRSIPYHNSAWAIRYHKKDGQAVAALYQQNIDFLSFSETQNEIAEAREKTEMEDKIKSVQKSKTIRLVSWITSIAAVIAAFLGIEAFVGMRNARSSESQAEEQMLVNKKKIFEIYLRDSSDWWGSALLNQYQKQQITNTLFDLYADTKTHKPNRKDSLAGKKIEGSLLLQIKSYEARLYSWGNYLHLLKEAKDFDSNYATTTVFDSVLALTIPYQRSFLLTPEDMVPPYEKRTYLVKQLREPARSEFILLNRNGIYQYYNGGREVKIGFPTPVKPLAISNGADKILVLSDKNFNFYQRDKATNTWNLNVSFSAAMGKAFPTDIKNISRTLLKSAFLKAYQYRRYSENTDPAVDTNRSPIAAFSENGSQLVVYYGGDRCKLFNLFNAGQRTFAIDGHAQQFVFDHRARQLLVRTEDSTWLLSIESSLAIRTPLVVPDTSVTITNDRLSGWSFAANDSLIYSLSDSVRYVWTNKGKYLGKEKTGIPAGARHFFTNEGNTFLYLKETENLVYYDNFYRGRYGEIIYMQQSFSGNKRCFPWHKSRILCMDLDPDGAGISGDQTHIYTWDLHGKPITANTISRYVDSQELSSYYLDQGETYGQAEKESESIASYKKAIQYGSTYPETWEKVGKYYYNTKKKPDSALRYYKRALALAPENLLYLQEVGDLYYTAKNYDSAIACFSRYLRSDKSNSRTWNDLANVWYSKGAYDSSINYYRKALSLSPNDTVILNNLARACIEGKKHAMSLIYSTRAIALSKNYAKALYNKSNAYYYLEKNDSALKYILKAKELDSADADNWNMLGNIYIEFKNYDKSLECYNKAITLDPKDIAYLNNRSRFFNRQNNYQAAMRDADRSIKITPENPRGYCEKGYAYLMTHHFDAALTAINTAIKQDSSDYKGYYYLACYYALKNNKEAALSSLKKGIKNGFRWASRLESEHAFDGIRNDKDFRNIMRSLKTAR